MRRQLHKRGGTGSESRRPNAGRIVPGIVLVVLGACALAAVAGTAAASPPPGSPALTSYGGTGFITCGGAEAQLESSMSLYVLGQDQPPGWSQKLPPSPPPPDEKLLPQAPLQRDLPNIVQVDVANPCSWPFIIDFTNASGAMIIGLVAAGTVFSLDRDDLMLAGLWQFKATGDGMGGCTGGGPTCFDTPVDFIVTSGGVSLAS
jgi:hypothetical protein